MSVKSKNKKAANTTTLKDVAEALGVARSTVSNAYNRPDQLSETLREKILTTAANMGYTGPNPAARNLRRGVTNTIGLLYSAPLSYAFTDPATALFIQGIATEVEQDGYTLLLVGGPLENETTSTTNLAAPVLTAPVLTANVDGFIIYCFADDDPLLEAALARQLPSVMVDNLTVKNMSYVTIADEDGAYTAAKHLIDLGHKKFGIISLELDYNVVGGIINKERQAKAAYGATRARLKGYKGAIEKAGLSWDKAVTVVETFDNTHEEGIKAASLLLDDNPKITALLAMSDRLALGALAECRRRKLAVPDDLSIIGFDDISNAALSNPSLTTVHQSHVEKGRESGKLLLAQLKGEKKLKSITLETRLIVRDSCSKAPKK